MESSEPDIHSNLDVDKSLGMVNDKTLGYKAVMDKEVVHMKHLVTSKKSSEVAKLLKHVVEEMQHFEMLKEYLLLLRE